MNLFNYLKTRIAILDVVSEYATLKKAGLYWKGQCPFHQEKTASFTVSPHKEIFYCFGCHVGGDVINFISRMENCTQLEAAKHLIERYQIELPSTVGADLDLTTKNDDKHYYSMCQIITTWCNSQLLKSSEALTYLKKRGITAQSISQYAIGYMPGGIGQIKQFVADMAQQNILVDDLMQAHFISRGKNVLFSPYEERIIFPIADHIGRYCGFGGRIFKPHDTRAKYYNSHENEHFVKGALLFGIDRAKKEIQKANSVFLVEGYTDCVAMAQYGYLNTVATLGTACTLEHLKVLARYAQELFVLYDGDNAGQQAILRIGQLCWQASIDLKVISLPKGEDPASYLEKGLKLDDLIAQAQDIFTFFILTLGNQFERQTLGQKLQLTRKILEMIQKLDDPLKQDILLQKASGQLEIPFDSLKKELQRLQQPSPSFAVQATNRQHKKEESVSEPVWPEITTLENKIFFSIMNNIQLINKDNEEFLITYLPHPLCDILKKLQNQKEKQPELGFIQFFEILNQVEQHCVSKTLLADQDNVQAPLFEQLLVQLQKKNWKIIVHDIKNKLEIAKQNGDNQQISQLMQDFSSLKKKIIGKMLPE